MKLNVLYKTLLIAAMAAGALCGQTAPTPLLTTRIDNVTAGWVGECGAGTIDNRSQGRRLNVYHALWAYGGTGTWSVTIRYSNVSCAGPWTGYGAGATISQTSSPAMAFGYDALPTPASFVNISITGNVSVTYVGQHQLPIPVGGGNPGAPPYTVSGLAVSSTPTTITHNLGQLNVLYSFFDSSTHEAVQVAVTAVTLNSISITTMIPETIDGVISSGATSTGSVVFPCTVAQGCLGITTVPPHSVIVGNGMSAPGTVGPGTAGQVLTSNGASADPTYQAPATPGTTLPSGAQTQYLQIAPNTGNNTTYQFTSAGELKASDYNFSVTSGAGVASSGGTLAAGNNVLTFIFIPLGVNSSDVSHYLYVSGGTGTTEPCLITGGGGLQIIIQCANSHSGAWTISSATGGLAEAHQAIVSGTGNGTIQITTPITMYQGVYATLGGETITFVGQGREKTSVSRAASFTNGNLFHADVGSSWEIHDLGIQNGIGSAITGAAIFLGAKSPNWYQSQIQIDHVGIYGGQFGIRLMGAVSSNITDSFYYTNDVTFKAISAISLELGNPADMASVCDVIFITAFQGAGTPQNNANVLSNGIRFLGADSVWITNSVFSAEYAIAFNPQANAYISNIRFMGGGVDSARQSAVLFTGGLGPMGNIYFVGMHLNSQSHDATLGQSPVVYVAPDVNMNDVKFDACLIEGGQVEGILISNITGWLGNFQVSGSSVVDNNRSNMAGTSGVKVGIGVTGFSLTGSTVGNISEGHQKYAFANGGTGDVNITGADLKNNETGTVAVSVGLSGIIANNHGLNDGVTFANIPTNLPNGTVLNVTDANATCTAGASTGQVCTRVNGAWTSNVQPVYTSAGTLLPGSRTYIGTCTLGTNCAVTHPVAFTSGTSYYCTANDQTAAAAVKVVNTSASVVTFTGTGTDVIAYSCVGN